MRRALRIVDTAAPAPTPPVTLIVTEVGQLSQLITEAVEAAVDRLRPADSGEQLSYTVAEFGRRHQLSEKEVRRMISAGELGCRRKGPNGGHVQILAEHERAWRAQEAAKKGGL